MSEYNLNEILKLLQDNGITITGVTKVEGNIEKYYLNLIGGNANA